MSWSKFYINQCVNSDREARQRSKHLNNNDLILLGKCFIFDKQKSYNQTRQNRYLFRKSVSGVSIPGILCMFDLPHAYVLGRKTFLSFFKNEIFAICWS